MSDYDYQVLVAMLSTMAIYIVVAVVIGILINWFLFKKMGIAPWKCLIPFYNTYCLCEKVFGNGLWFLVMFLGAVPYVGSIVVLLFSIVFTIRLAKSFNKGTGFIFGLIFLSPIFEAILAFGSAEFVQLPNYDIEHPFE